MWRRVYLVLLIIRVYFALSPSYIHPDEVFQGPEVIAGELFGYRSARTWEWTVAKPIRSVFPLWPVYGLPMALLKGLWSRGNDGLIAPATIYYVTRIVMLILCFVLEDWAIHELVHSPKKRRDAVMLVASSYVTWTYQTHTFSNSVETLIVLWCLVLMQRIAGNTSAPPSPSDEKGPRLGSDAVPRRLFIPSGLMLGFLIVLGIFNRITFPAFLVIPGARLLPHLFNKPLALIAILVSATFWLFIAVATDTAFYTGPAATTSFSALFNYINTVPIFTPLNNLLYNSKASNLKQHGLHPHYQHILINLPQLLGPVLLLLIPYPFSRSSFSIDNMLHNSRLTAAITGTLILSVIPHQEPRFLLPCIPLILTCIKLPKSPTWRRRFWLVWGLFNIPMAILMGIYHQGGVVPVQLNMPHTLTKSLSHTGSAATNIDVYWWKTYPPSLYMLGADIRNPITTELLDVQAKPLFGVNRTTLLTALELRLPPCEGTQSFLSKFSNAIISSGDKHQTFLVAPFAAFRFGSTLWFPEQKTAIPPISNFTFTLPTYPVGPADLRITEGGELKLTHLDTYRQHLNLDDMDFGDDGTWPTLRRVIGRRGLGVWRVERDCPVPQE